ncbi:hypothetical protein H0X91_04360 [Burkholderia sp. 9777_1386]|uniref:hypothetical protein n=1 Tax=Burkholderia sp. 9777_1386 TaxID=2751183 RepID=UPI0018C42393|nr:hypothetical protein [Burkholderia sp. 9777_1386]MBG0869202.1 hypothetical protein [Burkholderia sp. 9777_1386]
MEACFKPVLDHLSALLPIAERANPRDHDRMIAPLLANAETLRETGTLEKIVSGRRGYLYAYSVEVGNRDHSPIIRIGSPRPAECHGALSFSLNPSKYSLAELERFHSTLERVIGDGEQCATLLRRAMLQSLHSAVDIPGLEIDKLVVESKYARKFETYSVAGGTDIPGRVTGMYFNALGSDARTCIYSKDDEQRYRLVEAMKGAKTEREENRIICMMTNALNGKPVTRIECRWHKLSSVPLYLAHTIPNRFDYLSYYHINPDHPKPLTRFEAKAFIELVRKDGLERTLADLRSDRETLTLSRRAERLWKDSAVKLYDADRAFNQTIDALKALPFFPTEAFENLDLGVTK